VPDSRTLDLLLVEDDLEDEHLLCDALLEIEESRLWSNWRSSRVAPVDRLADALDCLRRHSFDAVLLNLSLPDSPSLLNSFLDVTACAGSTPILVLADEPDENLANRLLREGAQDVLVKAEVECAPLARAIRYAIERQRRTAAERLSAFFDHLTGVLTRDAFLTVAAHRGSGELLALIDIHADRDSREPLLIQAAEVLRNAFAAHAFVGRWDQNRFCVLTSGLTEANVRSILHRAADAVAIQFSVSPIDSLQSLEEALSGDLRLRAKTAMLAD
jgi:PleD family two-component response regulator